MDGKESLGKNEIYSKSVRAGRRTYFFDVKKTRKGDLYLTLTESKKVYNNNDGSFHFEKHKLFLYKEDFDKFSDALNGSINFITENVSKFMAEARENGNYEIDRDSEENQPQDENELEVASEFTDVDFEDLEK